MGPDEPDTILYSFYPQPWPKFRRKLRRNISGVSFYRAQKGVLHNLAPLRGFKFVAGMAASSIPFWIAGVPELYLFLWVLPYVTLYWVSNRLRAIAEHAGMQRSSDKRLTSHNVRQRRFTLWRWWLVPYNVGYHLAHHVAPGVPFRNLPRLHRELERAGYANEDNTHSSYWALWRSLVHS